MGGGPTKTFPLDPFVQVLRHVVALQGGPVQADEARLSSPATKSLCSRGRAESVPDRTSRRRNRREVEDERRVD